MSEVEETETEETKLVEINDSTNDFLDEVGKFKIVDKDSFDMAALHLETIGKMKKVITEYWEPLIKSAFDTKASASKSLRSVRDKEEECLVRCGNADAYFRKIRLTYKTAQDKADQLAKDKAQEKAEAEAKRESDKLLKKAEKTIDPVREEALIEKADEVKVAPVFIQPTVKKSEVTENGTRNTFLEFTEIEVHDIKSIAGMVYKGELPVNVLTVSEAKIRAWIKMYDKKSGMYDGFNISITEKERITTAR